MQKAHRNVVRGAWLVVTVVAGFVQTGCHTATDSGKTPQASVPGLLRRPDSVMSVSSQPAGAVMVDAGQVRGGFSASAPSTGLILLHWDEVPGAKYYVVFRSTRPRFELGYSTILTMETSSDTSDQKPNHWADSQVVANARYYYAVFADSQKQHTPVAAGSCETPAEDGPLRGIGEPADRKPSLNQRGDAPTTGELQIAQMQAEQRAARRQPSVSPPASVVAVGPDELQREAFRQRDGVKVFTEGLSGNLPNGSYGFSYGPYLDVPDLLYHNDGEWHDAFELHRLSDGRYILLGYVNPDGVKSIKQDKPGNQFAFYSHRWAGATEIVTIPVEHLRMAGASNPNALAGRYFNGELVDMQGKHPDRAVGSMNRMMTLEWR